MYTIAVSPVPDTRELGQLILHIYTKHVQYDESNDDEKAALLQYIVVGLQECRFANADIEFARKAQVQVDMCMGCTNDGERWCEHCNCVRFCNSPICLAQSFHRFACQRHKLFEVAQLHAQYGQCDTEDDDDDE